MNTKQILRVVGGVRARWRLRVALRGLAWAAGITLTVLFLSATALERLRFVPEAVVWLRVLTWGTLAVTILVFLVRPLLRRVSDAQAALYLEEREPSLDLAVITALDAGDRPELSEGLRRRLLENALERARAVEYGRRIEQGGLYRFGGGLVAVALASLVLAVFGPQHLRLGVSALLSPTRDAAAVNPYSVQVEPGDATIARGSDQLVRAFPSGFDAADASVFTRAGAAGSFQRLSMLQAEDGGFEVLLLGLDQRTEYFVESSGVQSRTFTIDVADLPYVDRLDLTYRFPAYTGLAPRSVEDGGDVAALPGTVVDVRVRPTMLSLAGRLIMGGTSGPELAAQPDGTLVGSFTVRERGFYSVELAQASGAMVPASPEYTIDVLEDQDPSVLFSRPGRDTPASPIEEVYLEVRADDDYGVGDVRLVYSVNGGVEDTVAIFQAGRTPLPQVSAGHTLFLEEWPLEAGDLVSYYALVRDNRGRDGKAVASDMFFLKIRPFERAYREAEQQGGGAPQGGGTGPESAMSELQRQIISATFNLLRQRSSYGESEFSENIVSVALSQRRLREQVQTLLQRMQNRGLVETDPGFRDVSAILPRAAEAMDSAGTRLDAEDLQAAIPHEQAALRFLQQAEETYERYVSDQANQQGGGGGGNTAADDLADLFELELDKLKNQYETVRRGQQESADQEVDELLEELRELARRQEQEAERQRRRAQQAGQGAPRGGSANQRELAEQAEEAARQLQRLARQNNDAELQDAARQLQQAAEAMRQGAAQSGTSAAVQADAARRRLEEARRRLEQTQADRARRDAEEALRRVDELTDQQRQVQRAVRELPVAGQERAQRIQQLRERKDQMTEAVQDLERSLDRSAADARAEQPDAARELQDAADRIRESKLKEKLQYSRGTIEQWSPEQATTLELNIEADLQSLREGLVRALDAAGERREDPLREALEDTRELVRGIEAMDRRLRESPSERADRSAQPEPGAQPAPGEQESERPAEAATDRSTPAGGATRGDPRGLTDEQIRQYAREFGQRSEQVRGVRDRLMQAGRPIEDLQAVLDAMARLEREGIYGNPAQVADLNEQILEALKALEFGLRREVEGESERRATLTGSDEVPTGYRTLVEEYYKALARGGRPGGGS